MWDTGSPVGEIVGHVKTINSVDYKPTRPFRICTASEDKHVGFHEGPPFKFKSKEVCLLLLVVVAVICKEFTERTDAFLLATNLLVNMAEILFALGIVFLQFPSLQIFSLIIRVHLQGSGIFHIIIFSYLVIWHLAAFKFKENFKFFT